MTWLRKFQLPAGSTFTFTATDRASQVAVTVASPGLRAVTRPEASTLATAALDVAKVVLGVASPMVRPPSSSTTTSCWVRFGPELDTSGGERRRSAAAAGNAAVLS